MGSVLKGGVILAVAAALLTVIIGVTGLHKNPILSGLGFIVIAIALTVAIVFWVLKQTAPDSGYGKQLLNAILVGLVAGILVFVLNWLILSVLMPNYLDESIQASIETSVQFMENAGVPEEQIQEAIEKAEATTPVSQSVQGGIMTFITCLITGAIIAIFKRRK